MSLGRKIAKLRKQVDWTQEQFAEKVGVHGGHISRWEQDKSKPSVQKIKKIAEVFGISPEELIKEEEDEGPVLQEQDKALIKQMRLLEDLNEDDKIIVIKLIQALAAKRRMEKVLRSC